jgi:hypothetical protein
VLSEVDDPIHQQFTISELRAIVELAGLADRWSRRTATASRARSKVLVPRKCPWHSHIPGITAEVRVTAAPGVDGAAPAGPA